MNRTATSCTNSGSNQPAKDQAENNSKNNQASSNAENKTNMCVTGANREIVLLPSAVVKFKNGSTTEKAHILLGVRSPATFVVDTFVKSLVYPSKNVTQ